MNPTIPIGSTIIASLNECRDILVPMNFLSTTAVPKIRFWGTGAYHRCRRRRAPEGSNCIAIQAGDYY
jgi:hypothetical protein